MEEKIVLLRNRGKINPKKAEEYAARGGYEGLRKALSMDGSIICKLQLTKCWESGPTSPTKS